MNSVSKWKIALPLSTLTVDVSRISTVLLCRPLGSLFSGGVTQPIVIVAVPVNVPVAVVAPPKPEALKSQIRLSSTIVHSPA